MSALAFRLFGKFSVERDAQVVPCLEVTKEQELLSYLLLHRDRSYPREFLATLLWSDSSSEKSRKYLRQALWRLHSALQPPEHSDEQLLMVEHDWVQLNSNVQLNLDVLSFESAYQQTEDTPGKSLDNRQAELLKDAVNLYRGDLLEGWYQDWCLFERERLQNIYLLMLDKLMSHSLAHEQFEAGQGYGAIILRHDRASERTYRRLMQLKYLAGDRTGALRQYKRCIAALAEELGVEPEQRTVELWERIRTNTYAPQSTTPEPSNGFAELLERLKNLQSVLNGVQKIIQRDINAVEGRE